jgi:hypothetical protein
MMKTLTLVKEKSVFHKFRVEKSEGTPYRTHSYLLSGARPEKTRAARRRVFPPCSSRRKVQRNMLLV